MAYRDYKWPFILYTDTRKEGLGLLLACIQDGREYIAAYSKRIFQPSKQNDPKSSSFRISCVLMTSIFSMRFCSIPWHWSLLRERSFTWSISSSCFQRNTPSSHTLFNSCKTFTHNRGSADHGLQAADLDSFLLGLQTEILHLDHGWQRVFPEGIRVLMPADISSYLLCRFRMSLWTLQAKWNNKINSLLPLGDTLQTPVWSLNRSLPQQMLRGASSLLTQQQQWWLQAPGHWRAQKILTSQSTWGTAWEDLPGYLGLHRKLELQFASVGRHQRCR